MYELIITIDLNDKEYLSDIRCYHNVMVSQQENIIWVRGIEITENIDLNIRKLPVKATYILGKDNELFPLGSITPTARLKNMEWLPINYFIKPEFPHSLMPGKTDETYDVKLIQSEIIQDSNALVTDFSIWKSYTEIAPDIRLKPLKFAVSSEKKVIIIGEPLPAVPGMEYWMYDNLLIPSGYNFELPIVAELLINKVDPSRSFFILFDIKPKVNSDLSYQWEKISKENFVFASRSAVRLTSENLIK